MFILIAGNFKALRHGEFVEAASDSDEFLLDTSLTGKDQKIAKATLKEVCSKNKIKFKNKDGAGDLVGKIENWATDNKKLPEQKGKSDSVRAQEIVDQGVEDGLNDDQMLVKIVESGIKFKLAMKLFANAMASGGHRVSNKERRESAMKIMTDDSFEPKDYSDVEAMIKRLEDEIAETPTSSASKLVRAYCKEQELELPKAPKVARGGLRTQVQAHVLLHPTISKADFMAFVMEEKGKEEKTALRMWNPVEFAQKVAAATIALSDQEVEASDEDEEETED